MLRIARTRLVHFLDATFRAILKAAAKTDSAQSSLEIPRKGKVSESFSERFIFCSLEPGRADASDGWRRRRRAGHAAAADWRADGGPGVHSAQLPARQDHGRAPGGEAADAAGEFSDWLLHCGSR